MTNQEKKLVEVIDYTPENLAAALCNGNLTLREFYAEKYRHYHFLLDYFNKNKEGHDVKTIVVENKYLSKSYLQDYSNFYSTCYVDYKRFCKRVHFFTVQFSEEQWHELLEMDGGNDSPVWNSYVGYIVVRPLPKAIIGATILKPFNEENTGRHYNAVREYKVNLLGKELPVTTLVYQEQDSVVGACATSALWSAFHKVSMDDMFQTRLLSPSEITKSVKSPFNEFSGRIFPNESLTLQQVLESINAVGLVAELIQANKITSSSLFKAFVYAYNKMGLPVLLLKKFEEGDHHLVTVAGYRLDAPAEAIKPEEGISLLSDNITRLYAHDDQVGPFARLHLKDDTAAGVMVETAWIDYGEDEISETVLVTKLTNPGEKFETKKASVEAIIIPLSDEIRISFTAVYQNVMTLDSFFSQFLPANQLVWDIYLEQSNKYKNEIFTTKGIDKRLRKKLLLRSLSKYIWIARAAVQDQLFFEVIFDATNVADANFCKYVNIYNDDLRVQLNEGFNNPQSGIKELILEHLNKKYLQVIEEEVTEQRCPDL